MKMIKLQYRTFWWQNLFSTLIFVPTLIGVSVLINKYPRWAYDPNVILKNAEFNILTSSAILMGLISLIFARNPSWVGFNLSCRSMISKLESINLNVAYPDNQEILDWDDVDSPNPVKITQMNEIDEDGNVPVDTIQYREKNARRWIVQWRMSRQVENALSDDYDDKIKAIESDANEKKYDIGALEKCEIRFRDTVDYDDADGAPIQTAFADPLPQTNIDMPSKPHEQNRIRDLVLRALIGMGCLVFVLSPIIVASTFMDFSNNSTAYIYYTNENQTNIIQVCISQTSTFFAIFNVAEVCLIFGQAILINPRSIKETTQGNLTKVIGGLDNKEFSHVNDPNLSGYDLYKFII